MIEEIEILPQEISYDKYVGNKRLF